MRGQLSPYSRHQRAAIGIMALAFREGIGIQEDYIFLHVANLQITNFYFYLLFILSHFIVCWGEPYDGRYKYVLN